MMTSPLMLPWWLPGPEAVKERERILASRFFLVRIAGNGDVWRCRNCHAKHTYLTLRCVEQPFSGITGGLYAYFHTTGLQGAADLLPPAQRARYDRIAALFNRDAPDLASEHPQTARSIATAESDMDVGSFALGLLEPISKAKAEQLARAINMRGIKPPFTLPGIRC